MHLSRKSNGPLSRLPLLATACLAAMLWGGAGPARLSAAQAPSADLLQLIADLVSDSDKQMRAIGLQQVRGEAPGEAATQRFVELLPKLRPDARAELVEALGERGDPVARPAVVKMADDSDQAVRAAALRALAGVGGAGQVPLLVRRLAADSAAEQTAAAYSLTRLKIEGVNRAMVATFDDSPTEVRVKLLEILAARHAKEAVATVLAAASDPETTIQLAALDALRTLAGEGQTSDLVRLLQSATTEAHRTKAEAALMSLCGRERDKCVPALAAGLADADAPTRQTLLQALARAGGPAAQKAVASCLDDSDQAVRDEAVRMLSLWPDRAVVPRLKKIAAGDNLRHHVLAVRGLVRLASPEGEQPADLELLGDTFRLARRRDEKQLALAVLGRTANRESLALAVALLDDPEIAEEAGWTAGTIAENLPAEHREAVRTALRQVLDQCQSQKTREQARKVLDAR